MMFNGKAEADAVGIPSCGTSRLFFKLSSVGASSLLEWYRLFDVEDVSILSLQVVPGVVFSIIDSMVVDLPKTRLVLSREKSKCSLT
jgi:hypothetical protein